MGLGDELIGSAIARGAAARGKRIAFGDRRKIRWGGLCREIYRGNPNVAPPGAEGDPDIEWVAHYVGNRIYHRGQRGGRWLYSDFAMPGPGEIYLDAREKAFAAEVGVIDALIEPNVKAQAVNKQWPVERYQQVADALLARGARVAQFASGQHRLAGVEVIKTPSFRHACAVLVWTRCYVGPEGGLHHAAAACGTDAVVIFGGFTHPRNTGYAGHESVFVGDEPCGSLTPCRHCRDAMAAIPVEQVLVPTLERISGGN